MLVKKLLKNKSRFFEENVKTRGRILLKKRRRRTLRYVFGVLGVLIFFGAFFYLFYLPKFRIKSVYIRDLNVLERREVLNVVEKILSQKKFLLPNDNILLVPKRKIVQELESTFLRLESVKIKHSWSDVALDITVEERSPMAVYCQSECFFVDKAGFLFAQAPGFEGDLILKIYDERGSAKKIGDVISKEEDFSELIQFKDSINNFLEEDVVKIVLKEKERQDFYLGLWHLIVDDKIGRDTALANLILTMKNIEDYSNLDYIDLRFDSKIFYKFQD